MSPIEHIPTKQIVLALVTDAFGGRGGIAQYNRDFLTAVAASGIVQAVAVLPRHAPDLGSVPNGIKQMHARAGRLRYIFAAVWIAFRLRPRIVFCGHLFMAPLARVIAWLAGAQLVVQMHGVEAWAAPTQLRRAAVECADLVLCVSRYTHGGVAGWATIAPERILVLPNTVGEAFVPGKGAALRMRWGLENKRVLLTVGRLDPSERQKGHDRVIAILPELVSCGHDVTYVVIGEGSDRLRLEDLACREGVADRVLFLGAVPAEELPAAYCAADLFVMPSTQEGFGIVFLEAMACGTRALGLNVAGAADALADGTLGTLAVEDKLAEAVARLLDAPKTDPVTLSRAVRSRFGRDAFSERVQIILGRLLQTA